MTRGADRTRAGPLRAARALALVALASLAGAAAVATAADGASSRVPLPQPAIAAAPGAKCVEDTALMRRSHMDFLKHQRDVTVHDGVRTPRHSLAECVDCHASRDTGRVTGSPTAFCESCHAYAAVKLECFECHSDRARPAVAAAPSGAPR